MNYAHLDELYYAPSKPATVEKKVFELDGIHFVFMYMIALFIFTLK